MLWYESDDLSRYGPKKAVRTVAICLSVCVHVYMCTFALVSVWEAAAAEGGGEERRGRRGGGGGKERAETALMVR